MCKVPYPGGGGILSSLLGKNIKRERGIMAVDNGHGQNGKGKQHHLPYNIRAVGKNIKWGEWEGVVNDGEEYQVVGNFIHPSF